MKKRILNIKNLLLAPLQKAKRNDGHLIAVKKTVNRGGKQFEETYYVRPQDVKNKHLKAGQAFQIHDKEGIGIQHRGKRFSIVKPHEKEKGKYHVRYEDGQQGLVHEKHILSHATPIEGKNLPEKQEHSGPPPRIWQNRLAHLPEDTQAHYKAKGGGDYTPERKALHEKIVGAFSDHVLPVRPGGQKLAILMAGGPAAGKSTILRHMMNDEMSKQFVMVNPDDVKEHIPEYQEAIKGSARNAAILCHEESSDLAEEIRDRAIRDGKHLIIDGTMKNITKYAKLIDRLKKEGYKIHMTMVDLDVDQAKHFARKRAERSGRWIPMDMLEKAYPAVRKSFTSLKDHADDFEVYNRRNGQPEMIWSKTHGIVDHGAVSNIFGGVA